MANGTASNDLVQTLERQKNLYDRAARLVRLGAWECDLDTQQLTWTDGVYELFELPLDTRLKRAAILDLYTDESRLAMETMRAEVIRGGAPLSLDARIRTYRGTLRWMRLSIDVVRENGRAVRVFGAKQDVTAERDAFARLQAMAERDALTGLANRHVFDERYREVVADEIRNGSVSALALVDLDGFKTINDELGHLAGDECLRQIAVRLRRAFRQAPLVARIGGDEFAVLLPAPLRPATIRQSLQRASVALGRPIFWRGHTMSVGASIGATFLERPHLRKRSELFAEADAALYAAKAAGRNTVRVFGDSEEPWIEAASRVA